jgi:protein involved in polysaccharide export with SLBB domain
MKAGKLSQIFNVFLCLFFWQGLILAQTPPPENNSQARPESGLNLIHLGDLIDVDVVGNIDYDWRGTLTPEGFLNGLDSIEERIYALCRKEEEVAQDIAKGYGKFLREPKVVVRIVDRSNRQPSTLFGAVKLPQRFQIKRPVYLNELIILAGGFTEKASGEIQIYRPGGLGCAEQKTQSAENAGENPNPPERFISASQNNGSQFINIRISELLSGKKGANVQILVGDIITVLEASPIYVIGGVATPKQIATRSQITLSRAITSAGGLSKDADPKKITIFRRQAGETKIIEADLDKIKAGQAEDTVLQAFDVVEVTRKGGDKSRYPPVIKVDDLSDKNAAKLPLRVID